MPQCVAYQKNVVYAFIKLSAKSHSFNISKIIRINTTIRKKNSFYISDADLLTYDPFGACTGTSFIYKLYG